MPDLMPIRLIKFQRAEGLTSECKNEHHFYNWRDAETHVKRQARTAPNNGTVHKCDVFFEWHGPNHRAYTIRFDLQAHHASDPNPLATTLQQDLAFWAGRARPASMTKAQYKTYRAEIGATACPTIDLDREFANMLDYSAFQDLHLAIDDVHVGQPVGVCGHGIMLVTDVDVSRNLVRAQGHGCPFDGHWFDLHSVLRHATWEDVAREREQAVSRNVGCHESTCWCVQYREAGTP